MVDSGVLFGKMLMLLVMMCIGFVAGKTNILTNEGNRVISGLINNVASPCMVLYSAVCNDHALSNGAVLQLIGIAFASYFLLILVSKLYMCLVRPAREQRGLYEYIMIFSNLGFMGIPVISAVYGTDAVFYISIFIMVFYLFVYSYGSCLIQGIPMNFSNIRQVFSPMMVASMLGIVLYLCNVRLPDILTEPLNSIGQICTPCSMLLTGSMLAQIPLRGILKHWKLFPAAAGKLFIAPIVTNLVFRHVIHDELILGVLTLITAMPIAANMSLLASQYGKNEELCAVAVFLTTICSVLTIPLVAMLLL